MNTTSFDVVIVGGSYAGLSAAMALGRSMRQVLIVDNDQPCNRQTPHSHNFITHDGDTPAAVAAKAKEQVMAYPTIQRLSDTVTAVTGENLNFVVETASGKRISASKILLATGVKDLLPDLKGFRACWGISALHCPYCHGYEVRNTRLGVLANGDIGHEFAKLISQWSADLTLYTNGPSTLSDSQRQQLQAHRIPVVEKEMAELVHDKGYMTELIFSDGSREKITALFARIPFQQYLNLGCELGPSGHVVVDMFQKTSVKGIYAAGDCSSFMRSLAVATASGSMAGAMINKDLIEEKFA